MTEYDYSPEAYERYIAKQQSIARWVERQAQEAPRYANPFLPSEAGQPARTVDDRRRSVTRSFSTPVDARHNSPSPARHHHRSHSQHTNAKVHTMHLYSAQHSSTPTLVQDGSHGGSRSHSHSRSSSRAHARPPPSRSQNYTSNPAFSASQTQLHRSSSHRSHGSSTAHAVQYSSKPGQPVIWNQGKQTYVVIPTRGGRVEVRSPNSVYATSPTRGPASAHPAYPVPSKKPPLLKRLFHGGGSQESARRANVTVVSGDARRRRTSFF
ncbi:hypothetical protein SCHPADRAFT_903954 [Schizopora paradoxa]|uniref:Uncharacterized protein n=1 Tax=Schizopora paradoxa TaxID=27342 RepID=A0A0H2RNS6_9AGAM|nr:hypothetical protein SCHPADRAFT_903954 [Schizopora paradoxa]